MVGARKREPGIQELFGARFRVRVFDAPRNDRGALPPVGRQRLLAGLAEPRAVLLQAGQHHLIAVIEMRAAKARRIARAGVMPLLLRVSRRRDQNKRKHEKKSGHLQYPLHTERDSPRSIAFSGAEEG